MVVVPSPAPPVFAVPLTTNEINEINSGLLRSTPQDFFEEGRRQLDAEIVILLRGLLTSPEKILRIDEDLRAELCTRPHQLSSQEFGIVSDSQLRHLNEKVREICLAYSP